MFSGDVLSTLVTVFIFKIPTGDSGHSRTSSNADPEVTPSYLSSNYFVWENARNVVVTHE